MTTDFNYFTCIPLTVFNSAGLAGTYAALNGSGFEEDIKVLKVYNASNTGFTISYDNVDDHDFYPAGATFILDLQTNHATNSAYGSGTWRGRKGQVIYGKGSAGVGNLYIIGYR